MKLYKSLFDEGYQRTFPGFEFPRGINIPRGYYDASDKNDVSPHWEKDLENGYLLQLWIDDENPDTRESDFGRYTGAVKTDGEIDVEEIVDEFLAQDDYSAVIKWLQKKEREYNRS